MNPDRRISAHLGLRTQIALALFAVLAIAIALAGAALRPLAATAAQSIRRPYAVTLTRAIAGQIALLPADRDVGALLRDSVGPGALRGVALYDGTGRVRARAGSLTLERQWDLHRESIDIQPTFMAVTVDIPGRGYLRGEMSLEPTVVERGFLSATALYSSIAAVMAMFVVFVVLTVYTVRPIEALTRVAERVAAGRRGVRADRRGAREIVRAAEAFDTMTGQLAAREEELSARVTSLERATEELRSTRDQLVRTERLAVVGRLAAGIAHEVGNPLAAIVGLAELLKDPLVDPAERVDFAGRIERETQRIHRTVRDLLDYARAAPPEPVVPDASGDIGEAMSQVERLVVPQKSMRDVQLVCVCEPNLPTMRLATDRAVQVLLNLVLNSADALHAAARAGAAVDVRAMRDDGMIVLEVEDNGSGIDPELRAQVFQPFYTTKAAGQGTGLGLAICTVLVEQVGGTIVALERRDGAPGARIRVRIPIA